ncbi:uncharacterized protein LOC135364820 [Mirounga angustirostris]|uniref:uncharacterized protein LOC135364820 n=1 Tax=Mirounga angustirostris TaxID=9716 RepID=UPI00313C4E02
MRQKDHNNSNRCLLRSTAASGHFEERSLRESYAVLKASGEWFLCPRRCGRSLQAEGYGVHTSSSPTVPASLPSPLLPAVPGRLPAPSPVPATLCPHPLVVSVRPSVHPAGAALTGRARVRLARRAAAAAPCTAARRPAPPPRPRGPTPRAPTPGARSGGARACARGARRGAPPRRCARVQFPASRRYLGGVGEAPGLRAPEFLHLGTRRACCGASGFPRASLSLPLRLSGSFRLLTPPGLSFALTSVQGPAATAFEVKMELLGEIYFSSFMKNFHFMSFLSEGKTPWNMFSESTRFTLGIYPNDVIMADCKNNSSTRIVITELRETGDNLNAPKKRNNEINEHICKNGMCSHYIVTSKTIECGGKCSQYIDKRKKKILQLLEYDSIFVKHLFYAEKHISVVKIYVTSTSLCFCEISKCFPGYMVYSEIKHIKNPMVL